MSDSTTTRICTKCKIEKPATKEFFYKDKSGKFGLSSRCKVCTAESHRQYIKDNPEKHAKLLRQWDEKNREKRREITRRHRKNNPEKTAEYDRQFRKRNPEKMRIKDMRRKTRKRNLPHTFTTQQWEDALTYFHGCCAVCGSQLFDLFGNIEPHADHWIALSNPDCPGTIATNMLPLCSHCNLSKRDELPREWLERKYGKYKAKKILERIETYFESVRGAMNPT